MSANVQFINSLSQSAAANSTKNHHQHSHDGDAAHSGSHDHGLGEHGHTHEHLDHPGVFIYQIHSANSSIILIHNTGKFSERDLPDYSLRNFEERGFTVGIGGYGRNRSVRLLILLTAVLILQHPGPWAQARQHSHLPSVSVSARNTI